MQQRVEEKLSLEAQKKKIHSTICMQEANKEGRKTLCE